MKVFDIREWTTHYNSCDSEKDEALQAFVDLGYFPDITQYVTWRTDEKVKEFFNSANEFGDDGLDIERRAVNYINEQLRLDTPDIRDDEEVLVLIG